MSSLNVRIHLTRKVVYAPSVVFDIKFGRQEQVSGPRGNGRVQFWVVPLVVITTFAVALPS